MNQENPCPPAASAVVGSAARREVRGLLSASFLPPSIAKRSRVWFERPRQRLEEDPEEERGEPEQKPSRSNPRTGRPGRPPRSARRTSACTGRRTLVDCPAGRERLLQIFLIRKKFPHAMPAPHTAAGSIETFAARRDRDPIPPRINPRRGGSGSSVAAATAGPGRHGPPGFLRCSSSRSRSFPDRTAAR